jgi:hypothetical protein
MGEQVRVNVAIGCALREQFETVPHQPERGELGIFRGRPK